MLHWGAVDYLKNNVGTCNWARSKFEGRKYNILTTNIAESVNSFIRELQNFLLLILLITLEKYCNNGFMIGKLVLNQ